MVLWLEYYVNHEGLELVLQHCYLSLCIQKCCKC